jgi:hypothetical protein
MNNVYYVLHGFRVHNPSNSLLIHVY